MNEDELLQTLARETTPTEAEIGAVRRALAERATDGRVSEALLRHLPPPSIADIALARRLFHDARRAPRWGLFAAGFGTAIAAVALGGIAIGIAWAWTRGSDGPLAGPLAAADAPVHPTPHVALTAKGTGDLGGTAKAPRIEWTQGELAVEVDPGNGIDLQVVTREATVRVVGTVFTVDRGALGTEVSVTRGKVEVTCAAGSTHLLGVGETATCVPVTAPGLLARANALKARGAGADEILAAVDAGLPLASGPFVGELRALRAETLLEAGRASEALADARAYLKDGGPRRVEVLGLAAAAAMRTEGCEGALPFLQDLEGLGKGDPELLQRCER